MTRHKILLVAVACVILRVLAFVVVRATAGSDAQWQLAYLPLWIIDFPISAVYFIAPLPIPTAEAIIGPIWWFFLPISIWAFRRSRSRRMEKKRKTVSS